MSAERKLRRARRLIDEVIVAGGRTPDREPLPDTDLGGDPDEPPPRDPPPPPRRDTPDDPPPPPDDPPVRGRDPISSKAPVERIDPVTPTSYDLVMNNGAVHLAEDTSRTWPTLRNALHDIGPGHRGTIVVGVHGDGGYVQLGDKNSVANFPLDIAFVGVTQDATIGPIVQSPEDTYPVLGLEFHSIGIVANKDSKAFHQRAFIGRMILNSWWFIPLEPNVVAQTQGWYCTKGWDTLIVKGFQPRDFLSAEHIVYPKGGGATQFLDNDMRGFGRCFVNHRPHQGGTDPYVFGPSPPQTGAILFDGNHSKEAGWDRPVMGGGAVMTTYLGLEFPTVFRNNTIENARMGAIVCGRGAPNTHPYETSDGYSFSQVWLEGNELHVNGSQGSDPRHCVNVSDIRELIFSGPNRFRSDHRMDLQLNSAGYGGRPIGDIRILGRSSMPDYENGGIWVEALNKSVPLTAEDLIPEIE